MLLKKYPEQFKLVAICDIRKPQDVHKYGDILYFDDYHLCCKSEDIDVVIVSTPPAIHLPIVLCALENKKKVIVEKPITTTLEDAKCNRNVLKQPKLRIHIYILHITVNFHQLILRQNRLLII